MIEPYGGKLVERILPKDDFKSHVLEPKTKKIVLRHSEQIHLINIATGCYSPLKGFMTKEEYRTVLTESCLPSGLNWTIPIILTINKKESSSFRIGDSVILVDTKKKPIGILSVNSVFQVECCNDAMYLFGTRDKRHPGVKHFCDNCSVGIGGNVYLAEEAIPSLRYYQTPSAIRTHIMNSEFKTITAFSTRNICHIGHEYLHHIAFELTDALGINVITGAQIKGKFLPDVVFDTYEYLIDKYYPKNRVFMINFRIPPLYGGPREAFHQALMLQNMGFSHFIVGRDHAGIGDYYDKYESQEIFEELTDLDIHILAFSEPRYCKICGKVTTERSCKHKGNQVEKLNGRDARSLLLEKDFNELAYIMRNDLLKYITRTIDRNIKVDGHKVTKNEIRKILFY
tara:strand:- start:5094 stop:6290 length:1197 start_codon:yes stop_codon:yes gene_type:complete